MQQRTRQRAAGQIGGQRVVRARCDLLAARRHQLHAEFLVRRPRTRQAQRLAHGGVRQRAHHRHHAVLGRCMVARRLIRGVGDAGLSAGLQPRLLAASHTTHAASLDTAEQQHRAMSNMKLASMLYWAHHWIVGGGCWAWLA